MKWGNERDHLERHKGANVYINCITNDCLKCKDGCTSCVGAHFNCASCDTANNWVKSPTNTTTCVCKVGYYELAKGS